MFNECCGIKVCFKCDIKFTGLCSVCDNEEFNKKLLCDNCSTEILYMNVWYCGYCDNLLCKDCIDIKIVASSSVYFKKEYFKEMLTCDKENIV